MNQRPITKKELYHETMGRNIRSHRLRKYYFFEKLKRKPQRNGS